MRSLLYTILFASACLVQASPSAYSQGAVSYTVIDQSLRSAISSFAQFINIRIEIDRYVNTRAIPGSLIGGVDSLIKYARENGVFVYYDGITYKFSGDKIVVRAIVLDGMDIKSAIRTIDEFFPYRPPQTTSYGFESNILRVAGPLAFVDAAEAALRASRSASELEVIKYGNKVLTKNP